MKKCKNIKRRLANPVVNKEKPHDLFAKYIFDKYVMQVSIYLDVQGLFDDIVLTIDLYYNDDEVDWDSEDWGRDAQSCFNCIMGIIGKVKIPKKKLMDSDQAKLWEELGKHDQDVKKLYESKLKILNQKTDLENLSKKMEDDLEDDITSYIAEKEYPREYNEWVRTNR